MRISDWSSDVCSSDLPAADRSERFARHIGTLARVGTERLVEEAAEHAADDRGYPEQPQLLQRPTACDQRRAGAARRSEEHTSELQSLMRIWYAVFCLKRKSQSTGTS